MKKHLIETIEGDFSFRAESLVTEKEAEGWELITPIQIIPPRQTGAHFSEQGWLILTFEKEVQDINKNQT